MNSLYSIVSKEGAKSFFSNPGNRPRFILLSFISYLSSALFAIPLSLLTLEDDIVSLFGWLGLFAGLSLLFIPRIFQARMLFKANYYYKSRYYIFFALIGPLLYLSYFLFTLGTIQLEGALGMPQDYAFLLPTIYFIPIFWLPFVLSYFDSTLGISWAWKDFKDGLLDKDVSQSAKPFTRTPFLNEDVFEKRWNSGEIEREWLAIEWRALTFFGLLLFSSFITTSPHDEIDIAYLGCFTLPIYLLFLFFGILSICRACHAKIYRHACLPIALGVAGILIGTTIIAVPLLSGFGLFGENYPSCFSDKTWPTYVSLPLFILYLVVYYNFSYLRAFKKPKEEFSRDKPGF